MTSFSDLQSTGGYLFVCHPEYARIDYARPYYSEREVKTFCAVAILFVEFKAKLGTHVERLDVVAQVIAECDGLLYFPDTAFNSLDVVFT